MPNSKRALITGITGQDGSYLAEFLLDKGYEVHGLVRRVSVDDPSIRFSRISHLLHRLILHYGDVTNYSAIWRLIAKIQPDEVYHLASTSHVLVSFEDDLGIFRTNMDSTHYLLSAIKELKPDCKFYFAASSEMFGQVKDSPQNENTPLNPVSPYAISKTAAFYLTKMFRHGYGIFACSGILFNHESPRRGFEFVTRKISSHVAKIKLGLASELRLGNLDAKRDWGFAGDYVEAMWLMLQHEEPDDYVIGTGQSHSVREFLDATFGHLGLDWKKYVLADQNLLRPIDVAHLRADYSKARKILGWKPKTNFTELAKTMVESDLANLKSGSQLV